MKKLRLVVFDVDGTLVKVESSWQHLHEQLGTWDRGRKYAERFLQDFMLLHPYSLKAKRINMAEP